MKRNGLRMLHSLQYVYGRGLLWHVNRAGPINQLMDEAGERVGGHLLAPLPSQPQWSPQWDSAANVLTSSAAGIYLNATAYLSHF